MSELKDEIDAATASPELLKIVCPSGQVAWKKGEVEKLIEEKVVEGGRPVIHLDREMADYHMERVQKMNVMTMPLLELVFKELIGVKPEDGQSHADMIREYAGGIQHIAGVVELCLAFSVKAPSAVVNVQYPEQLLHPAHQVGLGDLFHQLAKLVNGQPTKVLPHPKKEGGEDE